MIFSDHADPLFEIGPERNKNVKRKNFSISLMLIVLAAVVFVAYTLYDSSSTDSVPPTIKISDEKLTLSVNDGENVLLTGVTAEDDKDGDVTASLIVESVYGISEDGSVTVRYAAFDSAGNVASAERTVVYSDYQSPVIMLNSPLVFEYGSSFDVFDCVSAYDVFDGDVTRKIKATMLSEGASVSTEGTHEVQFRVTNSVGDSVQLVLPVEVYPDDTYNGSIELSEWIVYLPVGAEFDAYSYLESFNTVYEEIPLTDGVPDSVELIMDNTVDTEKSGVYTVSYTAVKNNNDKTYIGYTKLIVVVEGGNGNG